MTLNDGHVFCPLDQVGDEIAADPRHGGARRTGRSAIPPPRYRLSRRGDGRQVRRRRRRRGTRSEAMLATEPRASGLAYDEAEGEAAFYGPKIDLQVEDPQGREETLSTVQVDFHLPAQFELSFRRGDARERPVMIHRSIVSTMERMVAHVLRGARRRPARCGSLRPRSSCSPSSTTPSIRPARCAAGSSTGRSGSSSTTATRRSASRVRDAQQRHDPVRRGHRPSGGGGWDRRRSGLRGGEHSAGAGGRRHRPHRTLDRDPRRTACVTPISSFWSDTPRPAAAGSDRNGSGAGLAGETEDHLAEDVALDLARAACRGVRRERREGLGTPGHPEASRACRSGRPGAAPP